MRPIAILPDGSISEADLNGLYASFATTNRQLGDPTLKANLTPEMRTQTRKEYYDGVKALMGVGVPYADQKQKGLLNQIHGAAPKKGYFQNTLADRRQDMSMRSTIIPEPNLGLDEVGLPKHHALDLFRPMVVRKMVTQGFAKHPLEAQKMIASKDSRAYKALESVMDEKAVLMKRDPALHKYSLQGFKPRLTEGSAIKINPLVCSGYGADFDGNCCSGESRIVLTLSVDNVRFSDIRSVEEYLDMKFSETTKIYLWDGAATIEMRIDEMPRLKKGVMKDKNGADVYKVPKGLSVWSYCHETGQSVMAPVSHLTVEENCESYRINTRRFAVTASGNESLCVYNHDTGEIERADPKKSIGKLSPVTRKLPVVGSRHSFEFGWLIGAFVSDGFITGKKVIGYSKESQSHRDRFVDALKEFAGSVRRATYSDYHDGTDGVSGNSVKDHYRVSEEVVDYFRTMYSDEPMDGRSCLRKRLPNLDDFSEEALLGVLTGLFDGDGSVSISTAKGRQVLANYCTSSPSLVESIRDLCRRLSIRMSKSTTEPKEGRLQTHDSYTISFSTPDLVKYAHRLCTVSKSASDALDELQAEGVSKDDLDIVPVPRHIMNTMTAKAGPCGVHSMFRSLSTIKSNKKVAPYVRRSAAMEMLELLDARKVDVGTWRTVVMSTDIHWDVVKSVEPVGNIKVYDLDIPSTKVFVVNGGLVIWDTMSVFVPVGDEAQREAHKMMPSNNLFSEASGKVMYAPSHEAVVGLYRLSAVNQKKAATKVGHPGEALDLVKKGKLTINDPVKIGKMTTTPGRVLLSSVLPEPMQKKVLEDQSLKLDKKGLGSVLEQVGREHKDVFGEVANKLNELGNGTASGMAPIFHPDHVGPDALDPKKKLWVPTGATTLSLDDLEPDRKLRSQVLAVAQKKVDDINKMSLTKGEKERRTVSAWSTADEC
jgi:hypothetical protein